jgi:hypothetical protein
MSAKHISLEINRSNLKPTPIMDYNHPSVQIILNQFQTAHSSEQEFIQSAHHYIKIHVLPVYTLDEFQPVSQTLRKKKGSCSQRMACLEAVSRANKIATRVRGLWIDGHFWYPRFQLSRPFIPKKILLALPQFYLNGRWIDFDEIYGETATLAQKAETGFSNSDETLFEAVEHTAVDFFGKTRECGGICSAAKFDLSKYVIGDEGYFATREELFTTFGSLQYSCRGRSFEVIFDGRKSV